MTVLQQWARRPQGVWLRKALFQVHLWTGIGVGLYVFLISVSGSVLVYRVELLRAFSHPTIVQPIGERLPPEEIHRAAVRAFPREQVAEVWQPRNPNQAAEVTLESSAGRRLRLLHPYTGQDLGNKITPAYRTVQWLLDFHDNLNYGDNGRLVNGVGGLLFTVLGLTGAVIWWPGVRNWRRSLTVAWKAGWKRVNWDLHSALGIWTLAFVLLWGISGVYLAFARQLAPVFDYLEPMDEHNAGIRHVDRYLATLSRLHFGRAYGQPIRIVWVVIGLSPLVLFVTGALMWWNRVLRHGARFGHRDRPERAPSRPRLVKTG
jgi:uncharacterized iron-regulated membrane protein